MLYSLQCTHSYGSGIIIDTPSWENTHVCATIKMLIRVLKVHYRQQLHHDYVLTTMLHEVVYGDTGAVDLNIIRMTLV